jgi:hypothetical protein
MPDFTTASVMLLIMSSLTLQANLFQEFQPMGGVSARLAEGDGFSCAAAAEINSETNTQKAATNAVFFMRLFYQNLSEDGKEMRKERVILGLSNPGDPAVAVVSGCGAVYNFCFFRYSKEPRRGHDPHLLMGSSD